MVHFVQGESPEGADMQAAADLEQLFEQQMARVRGTLQRHETRVSRRRKAFTRTVLNEVGLDAKIGLFTGGRMGGRCQPLAEMDGDQS